VCQLRGRALQHRQAGGQGQRKLQPVVRVELQLRQKIGKELEEAVTFAEESPLPDPAEVSEDVYA